MNTDLPYSIYKEITIDDYRVIVFRWMEIPKGSIDEGRNVICLDRSGNTVWQIETFPQYPGLRTKRACFYVGLNIVDDQLVLFNACNLRIVVDHKTGEVLEKKEIRW